MIKCVKKRSLSRQCRSNECFNENMGTKHRIESMQLKHCKSLTPAWLCY